VLGKQNRRDHLRAECAIERIQFKLREQFVCATYIGGGANQMVHIPCCLEQALHLRFAGHVGLMQQWFAELAQPITGRFDFLSRSANDQNLTPPSEQLLGKCQSHTRATAHAHDPLSFETVAHVHLKRRS